MDRELNRGLIRPPQVTYKELWMLGEKESNGKMRGKLNRRERGMQFLSGTFGVRRRKYVMYSGRAHALVGGLMRILNFICNFISSLVFFSLGLSVYQAWFASCLTASPNLWRLFVKN